MSKLPVIWLFGGRNNHASCAELGRALGEAAKVAVIGEFQGDLVLPAGADLSTALDNCPGPLRPDAFVWLRNEPAPAPAGMEYLPCRLFCWGEGPDPDPARLLPADPDQAARTLLSQAGLLPELAWLDQVQVNMPLRFLLGDFKKLADSLPLNFEVGLDAAALDGCGPAELDQARAMLAGRRVTVHLPFIDLSPGSPDPKIRAVSMERLNRAGDFALALGAKNAVCHTGYAYMPPVYRDEFARGFAAKIAPLARRLTEAGCGFAIENTFETGPFVLETAHRELAAQGISTGFCLDVGHALAFSRVGLPDWWALMSPHLLEVHLHDNFGEEDDHMPVGSGLVDWPYLGDRLRELETPPIFTLEPHRQQDLWASLRGLERVWGPSL